ncbi:hypothetical protein RhiJN_23581 [Ceratobasidium sp. AG-Ba]|nr:hypothetical protein RhiJN_23581 [Ceratobasidium sp. AG-Ba]
MRLVLLFSGLFYSFSQAWGLGLSWPADGGIISSKTIQISFDGGTAPYTLTVLGFNPRNADTQLDQFTNQLGPNVQWPVSVSDGYVRFNVTDATGGSIISYWQIVYPSPTQSVSTLSVASTVSIASVQSLQAYISGLSTSAQAGTGTARPQDGPTSTPASTSNSSTNTGPIVGGVIGGVAGLLIITIFVFWWIRRSYPQPESYNSDDATTTAYGGWSGHQAPNKELNATQASMPYNPYQPAQFPDVISPPPITPSQVQAQQMQGLYGGVPEFHGGYR